MDLETKRLIIRGRVQGVGFRYSMLNAAHTIGVSGWVKNNRDGSVEAIVQGSKENVEKIIAWARRGPQMSEVDDVLVTNASGVFSGFDIV